MLRLVTVRNVDSDRKIVTNKLKVKKLNVFRMECVLNE
jgi:hypothetical protein